MRGSLCIRIKSNWKFCNKIYLPSNLNNLGASKVLLSTDWKQIAIHLAQNSREMSKMELMEHNRLRGSALDMNLGRVMNSWEQSMGMPAEIGSFLQGYRSYLPRETVEVLLKKSSEFAKLGSTQTESGQLNSFLRMMR